MSGAGVLRLVDQDVVDAAVELVVHPRHVARIAQELTRLSDQVVVVDHGALALQAFVLLEQCCADGEQCLGILGDGDRLQPPDHGRNPFLFGEQDVEGTGIGLCHLLGDQRRLRAGFQFLGQIDRRVISDECRSAGLGIALQPSADLAGASRVLRRAAVERLRRTMQPQFIEGAVGGCIGKGAAAGFIIAEVELPASGNDQFGDPADGGDHGGQAMAGGIQLGHDLGETFFVDHAGEMVERLGEGIVVAGAAEHPVAGDLAEFGGAALVDHGEMRCQAGFEREAAQQRFAERMDGADAQAFGRLDGLGEQFRRAGTLVRRRGPAE